MDATVTPEQRRAELPSATTGFASILFPDGRNTDGALEPPFFRDLNLDQIVGSVLAEKGEYDLAAFFHAVPTDLATITYRHEVFRDLENDVVAGALDEFATAMHDVRERLSEARKLYYRYQKEALFLAAASLYGEAVVKLGSKLAAADLVSAGLRSFAGYLASYLRAAPYTALSTEAAQVAAGLATIQYSLLIRSNSIQVRDYDREPDYTPTVTKSFERFQQGQVGDYAKNFSDPAEMNHVEAGILDFIARLHPDVFSALDAYCAKHATFVDPAIGRFDREIQFYIGWSAHRRKFEQAGLSFCYPVVAERNKQVCCTAAFDLALANKLIDSKTVPVTNDFSLSGAERVFVVSGPNQGGKTTFARTFGQLNYLAALGCPIPGRKAQTFLFDQIFTHFEREEDISTQRGKLEDDLFRIHEILLLATSRSIIIMNEIFTSTTLSDAILLGKRVMDKILKLDLLCVCVTFIDELAALGPKIVSVASTVVPEDPARRTFKIVRKPADGKAYAVFVAERYGLTFDQIWERLSS